LGVTEFFDIENACMQVDFIVIGAMKCGTSTVNAYLEDHPNVFMVPGRELNFFSHDDNYAKGLDWYTAQFRDRDSKTICGEASNMYSAGEMFPKTVDRMVAYNPDLKLIYLVRHPVDRIVSTWIQMRADHGDAVPATLDRAVIERPEQFIDPSLYWKNISRYRAAFPDEQIFVGFLEDLNRDNSAFFARLTAFLGVAPDPIIKRPHVNPSLGKVVPSPLYTTVNRIPLIGALKRLLPAAQKRFVKERILSIPVSDRLDFSTGIRKCVINAVREDAENFLAHYSKPHKFWPFE
jgi:hypothetical protein